MKFIKVLFVTKDVANKITFIQMLHELALKNNYKLVVEEIHHEKDCIKEIIHKCNLPNLLIVENLITLIAEVRIRSKFDRLPIIALHNDYKYKNMCESLNVGFINFMNLDPNNVWNLIEESQK